MDCAALPCGQGAERIIDRLEHHRCVLEIGLALFIDEQILLIGGQRLEKVDLFRNVGQLGGALLQDRGNLDPVDRQISQRLVKIRRSDSGKLLVGHRLDVLAVEPLELVVIEYGRRFADSRDVKDPAQLVEGKNLLIILGAPAEQGDIVDNRLGQIAVLDQILKAGGAVALG